MPSRIERSCRAYLCPNTTANKNGYCDDHQALALRDIDRRESASKRGYDKHWNKFRVKYLQDNPLCVDCLKDKTLTPATEVHHIRKLHDYPTLKYERSNLMALCHRCHSKRTARGE